MILYDANEYKFLSDGEFVLDKSVINPKVSEELNGVFNFECKIPYNFALWGTIKENMIIKANTPDGEQPFRIKVIKKDMDELYVFSRHIFYDFEDNFIEDTNIIDKSGIAALNQILSNTQYQHRFKGYSDIGATNNCRLVRVNGVSAILGNNDNTFINRWGGELRLNKWDIHLNKVRGNDNGVEILYRKNLTGIEAEIDTEGVITRIMPMAYNGHMLPEKYIDSKYIGNYPNPKVRKVEFSNIKLQADCSGEDEVGYETLEELYTALREACTKLYEVDKVDIPKANYKVNFVELADTLQYKNYALLERVQLGDIVRVTHEDIGIDIEARVINYEYDPIKEEYINIELGNFKDNYFSQIDSIKDTLDKMVTEFNSEWDRILDEAINNATDLINTGLGGFVVKRRNELLIMDTEDINTAKNVWRWNIGGLGFSSNGYNGPYQTALTNDGKIVLTEATVTQINAGLLKTGTITSIDNSISISLDNGELRSTLNDGSEIVISPAEGFYNKFGTSKRGYHHLNYSKLINFPADSLGGYSTVDVQLPAEYKGKNLQISTTVKRMVCNGGGVTNGALNLVDSFTEYNAETNVAKVYGLLKVVNLDNKQLVNLNQYLEVQLEVIA